MKINNWKGYGAPLARIGIALVFLIFGIDQFIRPEAWFSYIPSSVLNYGITEGGFILFNGLFDTLIGLFLLIGFFTRTASILAVLHLAGIVISMGYNDIAVRDFGLLIVALSVFLNGADKLCFDRRTK